MQLSRLASLDAMGRIKKLASERHTATASPFISDFVKAATSVPLYQLRAKLVDFPQQWPFPRGDLYHWISLLDRFDHVLELFNKEYSLDTAPQQEPFECRLLQKGDGEEGMPYPSTGADQQELDVAGFSSEGDRELVESILQFTRVLLEHCGNRSLYASSGHLNDLLHTSSLSLLRLCLKLGLRLAQRYQVARYKSNHPHAQALLLQTHYNINFDRLQKTAQPFPKPPQAAAGPTVLPGKGKEKASQTAAFNPCDLVAIAKEPTVTAAKADLASVHLTYYDQPARPSRPATAGSEAAPATPTPVRRTSALGPSRDRPSIGERSATASDIGATPVKSREPDGTLSSAPKTYLIPSSKVADTPTWALVKEALAQIPTDSAYEALQRIRVAKAFATPEASAQLVLEIRLLATANLAYALGESKFHERIGIPDSEEPKRFHLAQQLCDLLQPATNGQVALSLNVETSVLLTLEALSKSRHKSPEVSDGLQISHNHGILYYELRKVIATLNVEKHDDKKLELQETDWREATFDLTNAMLQSNSHQARNGERMVAAGIMDILVEALNLRTSRAERYHEKVLQFFDSFIHGIPTAFQTLASIKGLDILADLMSYEVNSVLQTVNDGNGLLAEFKSKVVDYNIPFYHQSTLRQLFKFMVHMFEHNAGTNDRLLRNLIDTPQVLGALRNVVENATVFGSNVWSGAVNIMSSFIHNEPTSFQVIGEAGLVKSLLQTIVPGELEDTEKSERESEDTSTALEYKDGEIQYPTPSGILPVGETMCDIPTAFGAICLNESGMKLFQSSKALRKYMDIFVSPPHVRALEEEGQTTFNIGQAFDELSRHHPQLKEQIMSAVVAMVKRVAEVSRYLAKGKGTGAKLWERTFDSSEIVLAGGREALAGAVHQDKSRSDSSSTPPVTVGDIEEDDKDRSSGIPFLGACIKFLDGFFNNTGMCSYFCEQGGAVYLLDLATSASNPYDLVAFPVFGKVAQVLKTMCEAKPHLVLPSLIRRTQEAIADLKPLVDNPSPDCAFLSFVDLSHPQVSRLPAGVDGTTVVKSLATTHMLTHILGRALSSPQFASGRHNQPSNQIFTILNFTDVYIELVNSLSQLHAACLWENLLLQKALPEKWKSQTDPKPFMMRRVDANGVVELTAEIRTGSSNQANGETTNGVTKSVDREETLALKNAKTARYLLSQTPMGIEAFFHALGQALVPKRSGDAATKQHASVVADYMAQALVRELDYKRFDRPDDKVMQSKYTVQVITACTRTMLRTSQAMDSWGSKEALTLVLNKFFIAGGFGKFNESLDHFGSILAELPQKGDALDLCARDALSTILVFYGHVVRTKCITEAGQTNAITVRDYKQADFFMPGQLLIEIRDAVLPAVSKLWHSAALEGIGDNHAKSIIEIIKLILKGDGEERALKRSDNASRRVQSMKPEFKLKSHEGLRSLESSGYDRNPAFEALYRCNNHEKNAQEYCNLQKVCDGAPSFPSPVSGRPPTVESSTAQQQPSDDAPAASASSDAPSLQRQRSVEMTDASSAQPDAAEAPLESEQSERIDTDSDDHDPMSEDGSFRGDLQANLHEEDLLAMVGNGRLQEILSQVNGNVGAPSAALPSAAVPAKDTHQPFTTVEDLDEKRKTLRDDLIDRCLEILSAQRTITFELADLIQAAVAKTGEGANPRAEIGTMLVSSLVSLQSETPSKESGEKIAAYAHLVALILQDRDFFDSTLDELKEYFDSLVGWVQLGQDQKAEDAPWIEMILLIIERVLTEDEQPAEIQWQPPPVDDPLKPLPEPTLPEPVVSSELRSTLFNALVDLLPKIGRNTSLALSVSRVLVTLTRRRDLALRLSDKHTMSRLFVMIRQLAGSVNDKLQGSFMIILRHMVEDEEILRQIMQTEIKAAFESHRSSRAMDTTTYTRNLHHLVLRDPKLFVDVTKEMLEVSRFDGNPHRAQSLALKKDTAPNWKDTSSALQAPSAEPTAQNRVEDASAETQKSVQGDSADTQKHPELKPPTVEATDGVVQFLLRELSNYRDVEDKPAPTTPKEQGVSSDVPMADAPEQSENATATDSTGKNDKPIFKPEEHAIYIYRCFVLQCLAELLASYNRTKVEFINFSRKPETQPATPSKPRSGTLNYLLNALIPVGTLEHRDDIAHRKKLSTSHWATAVLVSLCSKTPERQTPRSRMIQTVIEEDNDLTFVRKFVLEHALRVFKEASSSAEPLDQRYSRLLALGELFNRMLSSNPDRTRSSSADLWTSEHIGKLMYEKNFVSALTSAIAELDLNFPNAKRAVKYILGPLKLLTGLGVLLCQSSDLSSSATGATTEQEDISSATSISDEEDDEREHTPDLYRNSTLGMVESSAGREEESDSESEDEDDEDDIYDDGYDEEMDYEEEAIPDHGEVVSDEDEEVDAMEGMGDVEGMPGDVDMDIELVMDEDEDEDLEDDIGDQSPSTDDDDDDMDENEQDPDFADQMDEITGDDENASMPDNDIDGEWDEDDVADFEDQGQDGSPHGGPLDTIARVIGADERSDAGDQDGVVRIDLGNGEEEYFEDELPPEDDGR